MRRAEIDGEMVERQLAHRTHEIGAGRDGLRQRRRHRGPGERAEKHTRVFTSEPELAGNAAVLDRPGQHGIELHPGHRLRRHRELQRHLRRVRRAAPEIDAHRGATRDEASHRADLPGGRVDRDIRIDMLETLDAASAPGHRAVLERQPEQGRGRRRRGAAGLGRCAGAVRHGRRRSRTPVRGPVRQALEIDLGLDQGGIAQLDPAGQERQQRQLHFERAQPYHGGDSGAGRVGDADVPGGHRRGWQQAEGDRPGELDRVADALSDLGRDRRLEAIEVDELRRENEAGEDKDHEDAEQDCRFTQDTSPGQAAP